MNVTIYGPDGSTIVEQYEIADEVQPNPVADALADVRTELDRLSPTGATRMALEALVAAVESLV